MTAFRFFNLNLNTLATLAVIGACVSCTDPPKPSTDVTRARHAAGANGIGYSNVGKPEALPWGPPGIFRKPNGFIVPDNVNSVLHELDTTGRVMRSIDVRDVAVGIGAVASSEYGTFAVDIASVPPQLLQFDSDFRLIDRWDLALDGGAISGIVADDLGVLIEVRGGEELFRVAVRDDAVALEATTSYRFDGADVWIETLTDDIRTRVVTIGDAKARIQTSNRVARAEPIAAVNGALFVLVEDVAIDTTVHVVQSVWHIERDGSIAGVAIVPFEESMTSMIHGVTVDREGRIVAMITHEDEIELRELAELESHELQMIPGFDLRAPQPFVTESAPLLTVGSGCLTTGQIINNALEYTGNVTAIGAASIANDATCTGRWVPRYLSSGGLYASVSYDWGGFDSPTAFNTQIAAGRKAGNINTAGWGLSCSFGVDCSGFVSRAWGLSAKYSTDTLPSVSQPMTPVLRAGDILNRPFVHVVLFSSNATNGVNVFESTQWQNFDRVVYVYRPWSTLSGYQALRSSRVCP